MTMPPLPGDGKFWTAVLAWEDAADYADDRSRESDAVDAEVHAYARAYADERTRELVEALADLEAMAERYRPLGYTRPDAQKAARAILTKHRSTT